jgi:HK97 family phage prohead protease
MTSLPLLGDIEERTYAVALELRDVEATGAGTALTYLEGRAVPYGVWGDLRYFMEQHAADSFKQSTSGGTGKNLPLLLFHDNRSFPIGHAEKWRHDDGLVGVWKLNDTPEAQRAGQAVRAGDMNGMSVGFQPKESDWTYVEDWNPDKGDDHKDRVVRLRSRLLEVSLTPTPVFEDAAVTLVRSSFDPDRRQRSRRREIDAWRADVDRLRSAPS